MFLECLNLIKILPLLDEAVKRKGVAQNRLVSFLFQVHSILFTLHFIILSITVCLPPIFCAFSIFCMRHHFISQFTLENCFFFFSFTSFNINGLSANDMNTDFFRRGGKKIHFICQFKFVQWVKWIFFLRRLYILLLFSIFICRLQLLCVSVWLWAS